MIEPKYYSQNGEDYLLCKFFGQELNGFYVDIGDFDGIYFSNTFSFEQIGWKGICVESNPDIFELCLKNRPNSVCFNDVCIN